MFDQEASHSIFPGVSVGLVSLVSSSGPNRARSDLKRTLRMMPWATMAREWLTSLWKPRRTVGMRWLSMKRSTLAFIDSLLSGSIQPADDWSVPREPNFRPSSEPKFFSLSSGSCITLTTSAEGSSVVCASATASAVLTARCRLEAKIRCTRPTADDRATRCAPRRRAWRMPWFVREESREPALESGR